jgi:hypothetical protein
LTQEGPPKVKKSLSNLKLEGVVVVQKKQGEPQLFDHQKDESHARSPNSNWRSSQMMEVMEVIKHAQARAHGQFPSMAEFRQFGPGNGRAARASSLLEVLNQ